MDQGPKFQGCLEKQGRIARTWKKYWFILKDSHLTYVKAQDKMSSQGHIDMSLAQSVRNVNSKSGFQFEIVTRSKNHYLNADSADQRDKWVKILHDAMAWYSRHSSSSSISRLSGSTSVRASCNSIEDDDYGYSTVRLSPTGSPTRSSGYSTNSDMTSDASVAPNDPLSRDSGNSEMVCPNSDKGKFKSHKRSTLRDSTQTALYEDVQAETPRQSQHEGLRRLHPFPSKPTHSDSVRSDTSGIYDSIHEHADIAISHIVKGYANIARNKGPQPETTEDDEEEADYDDVFVDPSRKSRTSGILRKSSIERSSENPHAVAGNKGGPRTSNNTPHYATVAKYTKTGGAKPSISTKSPMSSRVSALPQDVEQIFNFEAINDLPNPRIELTHMTSFNGIRQFLANNRSPDEYYVSGKSDEVGGKAVRALRDYLAGMSIQ